MMMRMGKLCVLLLLSSPLLSRSQECTQNNLCSSSFCSSECGPGSACPLPSGHACSGLLVRLYDQWSDYCDCCPPSCVNFIEEGERCESVQQHPVAVCGPGLSCRVESSTGEPHCQRSRTRCLDALTAYETKLADGSLGIHEMRPLCDSEGNFEPLQCDYSVCQCVDEERGEPIFGMQHIEEQENKLQDCKCARRLLTLRLLSCRMSIHFEGEEQSYERELRECMSLEQSNFFPSTMRCLPNGNFDPIQCVHDIPERVEPRCGCVQSALDDQQTLVWNGTLSLRSTTHDLQCYDAEQSYHYPHYFRPCERILHTLDNHHLYINDNEDDDEDDNEDNEEKSTLHLSSLLRPICSPDGFFAEIQARHLRAEETNEGPIEYFCADRLGEPIGPEYVSDSYNALDCRCARMRSVLPDSLEHPVCCPDGSFRSFQCVAGGFCFCVDKFGRQTDKEVNVIDINELNCRHSQC